MFQNTVFNPQRLVMAREYNCLTKEELSCRIGVTTRSIAGHERGQNPSPGVIQKYSEALGFPIPFFYEENKNTLSRDSISFRSFQRVPAYLKNRAVAEAQIAVNIILKWLDKRFYLPNVDLPEIAVGTSPADAASTARSHWGLGCLPVDRLIQFLESKGVRIFSLSKSTRVLDGCSFWTFDGQPVILIDHTKSAERVRFSLMHEVGHLLLHKDYLEHVKQEEIDADRFSSCFLMPEPLFSMKSPSINQRNAIIAYKHYWGVSMSALVRRMYDIGLISEWEYRMENIALQKEGKNVEPSPIPKEESCMMKKILNSLERHGETTLSLANELSIPPDLLKAMCFDTSTQPIFSLITNERKDKFVNN